MDDLIAKIVKPLKFVAGEFPDELKGGDYHIWAEGLGFQVYFWSIVQGEPHRTLDEAVAWAQTHHRARIASALDLDALQALVAAAYEAAADKCGAYSFSNNYFVSKALGDASAAIRALAKSDPLALAALERVKMQAQREAYGRVEGEARRYAEHYPQSSDGRNTFILLADHIRALAEEGEG